MARAYSPDMRGRVIARVESGGSRREAAEYYDVSASTAVIWVKWSSVKNVSERGFYARRGVKTAVSKDQQQGAQKLLNQRRSRLKL